MSILATSSKPPSSPSRCRMTRLRRLSLKLSPAPAMSGLGPSPFALSGTVLVHPHNGGIQRSVGYVASPNRFNIPAFFELHVWAWRDNPQGDFVDWNDHVTCTGDN